MSKIVKFNSKNKLIYYWELTFGLNNNTADAASEDEPEEQTKQEYTSNQPYLLKEETGKDEQTSYVIAKCCNPIPGDEVIGYRSPSDYIVIHKAKCIHALRLVSSQSEHIIPTKWTTHKILSFLQCELTLKGLIILVFLIISPM